MKTLTTDVAIIGAGTAGLTAYRAARRRDADTLLIEAGPYGTTCAREGCMPSKLLIAAADAAHHVDTADQFGIRVDERTIDGRAVMDRVRRERDRFVGFVVDSTESIDEAHRLRGHARFLGPNLLQVGDDLQVEARAIVIATGSTPWIPPELQHLKDRLMTNSEIFEMEDLPESIAVFGPGVIGLELGQALHRLGVRVTFFSPFQDLGSARDPEIQRVARKVFGEELDLQLNVQDIDVQEVSQGFRVRWQTEDGDHREATFEKALVTAGRRPNLKHLDLEKSGLALDDRGIPIHDTQTTQCGDSPIFIAGDASHRHAVLHEAADEGRFAGDNAARFPDVRANIRRIPLTITFTDPQMASVGRPYDEVDFDTHVVGEVSYDNQGRARVMGQNKGLVRIYGCKGRGCLRGAELFGPRVEHTAHLLAWAIQCQLTVEQTLRMPFYHPVIEEGIRTGLRDVSKNLKIQRPLQAGELRYGPGT